jgi:DNA/RNA endonuclease G (NUC1)
MKKWIYTLSLAALILLPTLAHPHSGGTDAQGGHNNRTEGTYHFHSGPLDGQTFPTKEEVTAALSAPSDGTAQPTEPIDIPPPIDLSPFVPTGLEADIVTHFAYMLQYSEPHEQAAWLLYRITAEQVNGAVERTDNFRADPLVATGSASLNDYSGSGFDRGHLAPANVFSWDERAMSESFYLSNMSPQDPSFNRGIWRVLEGEVRGLAREYQGPDRYVA